MENVRYETKAIARRCGVRVSEQASLYVYVRVCVRVCEN